jgi:small subunit ribosomal protein S19
MPRVNAYRGVEPKELESYSIEKFLPPLTSRARRAVMRALSNKDKLMSVKKLIKKAAKAKKTDPSKPIRTHIREAVILPEWLGLTFAVYNGKEYKNVHITIDKIGYRLGDFSHTIGRVIHSGPGVGATRGSKFIPLK